MVEEDFTIKMEDTMKANGKTIRWMVMVNFTMKVANLPTRANGLKINSMALARSTMIIL